MLHYVRGCKEGFSCQFTVRTPFWACNHSSKIFLLTEHFKVIRIYSYILSNPLQDVEMDLIPAIPAPEFKEITDWANSQPLSIKGLKGKVVLIDCWTYTCIFCLRTIPTMPTSGALFPDITLVMFQLHLILTTRRGKLMAICIGQNMSL